MSRIDESVLLDLASLSQINFTEEESQELLGNLEAILAHMDQLQQIDTENVPVCHHILEGFTSVMREDEVKATLSHKDFMANSPENVGGMVRVPSIF